MAVQTNSPQVSALKLAIEKQFGHTIQTRSDFQKLVSEIEAHTHEHIAENTLRRLWGAIKGYNTVFNRTLDVLCRYVGMKHWAEFCSILSANGNCDSVLIENNSCIINNENLKIGDRLDICWLNDKHCVVEYLGGKAFKIVIPGNSTFQVGAIIECNICN